MLEQPVVVVVVRVREAVRIAREGAGHGYLSAAHFYAGVACWFEGDRDWAKFHWCHVVTELPDDNLAEDNPAQAAEEMNQLLRDTLTGVIAQKCDEIPPPQ